MTAGAQKSGGERPGVTFPAAADGRRSTSALGRAVVADALGRVDPAGALAATRESNWRSGYLTHFRRLVEAGLASRQAAVSVARDGLASLHQRMRVTSPDGTESGLDSLISASARQDLATVTVAGAGEPERTLSVPYRGERLSGDALLRRLEAWVAAGVIEPSCADAVAKVAASPQLLALPGRTVAVLGAGAEIGPLSVLLSWGVRVAAVDLPSPAIWDRVLGMARGSAGTLLVPVARRGPDDDSAAGGRTAGAAEDQDLTERAGCDLAADVPAVADWLARTEGPLTLGNYVYADGAANVRVASAVDALTVRLTAERRDVSLAFLATPTDVFAVPAAAVTQSARAYAGRSSAAKLGSWPLRALSGGRLLRPAYPPGADPGVCDSLIAQQGPNYVLAKRVQRWRATVARTGGATVSMNVAPPTRTRSVTKNRVLAAAYAGAGRFGVEVFEPATTKTLMAALLVHDLEMSGAPAQAHPWEEEARAAAHGGLWRIAYAPRSALTLAALLGYASARRDSSLPDERQAVVRVRRAARGGQHPREVVGQVAGTLAEGAPRQQVVQDRRGQGETLGRRDRVPAQRQRQVQAVHHRLDDPAGRELVHPHGREVPGPDGAGRRRAAALDDPAERLGQDIGHVRRRLAFHHRVGVLVDDRACLRARIDEEAGPVPGRLEVTAALEQHRGQADRDIEVTGQLEHGPVRQFLLHRH
ncbi:MAG TPA: hypothetical protein VFW50_09330 [Streptosporangiaceae bacterium]|nr:hypothetical protein [Streptosporangiaceae bacterium]